MKGALITLAEAKGMLHVDWSDDDPRISLLIGAASAAVLRFLKTDGEEYSDSSGEIVPGNVEDDIKAAVALLTGMALDLDPEAQDQLLGDNDLPKMVKALLVSRRLPTLA